MLRRDFHLATSVIRMCVFVRNLTLLFLLMQLGCSRCHMLTLRETPDKLASDGKVRSEANFALEDAQNLNWVKSGSTGRSAAIWPIVVAARRAATFRSAAMNLRENLSDVVRGIVVQELFVRAGYHGASEGFPAGFDGIGDIGTVTDENMSRLCYWHSIVVGMTSSGRLVYETEGDPNVFAGEGPAIPAVTALPDSTVLGSVVVPKLPSTGDLQQRFDELCASPTRSTASIDVSEAIPAYDGFEYFFAATFGMARQWGIGGGQSAGSINLKCASALALVEQIRSLAEETAAPPLAGRVGVQN